MRGEAHVITQLSAHLLVHTADGSDTISSLYSANNGAAVIIGAALPDVLEAAVALAWEPPAPDPLSAIEVVIPELISPDEDTVIVSSAADEEESSVMLPPLPPLSSAARELTIEV
ncbi:hypothetical protein Slin14017_G058590 [Septoria linicola]|nr:hypothetical protein Slin14017_G058590 [Septoria linicola]